MPALQSILVPVDGSTPSLAALEHAIALAQDLGARVEVLTVSEPDDLSDTTMSPTTRVEIDRAMKEASQAALGDARRLLGDRLTTRTEVGDPLRTIVTVANECACDLIVIGTYGMIGRLHAMLGSIAERVLRNAPCPVLIVREVGPGYQSFAERRHCRPTLAGQSAPRH